ncbi:MAG: hypothetical protein M5T61_18790 [Acidimicrobiia bacterium]|nr:hypothetical protein [Acidimicrobiia bacterium]
MIIQSEFLLNTDADRTALQDAYDAVWRSATEEEHKVLYWLSGAAAGVALHGEAELRERTDAVPLMVGARCLLPRGDHEGAVGSCAGVVEQNRRPDFLLVRSRRLTTSVVPSTS